MTQTTVKVTYNMALEITKQICSICEGILLRVGPYLKEGLYQDLLVHELVLKGFNPLRENVFGMNYTDSLGNEVRIGNNQSLRTDIELQSLKSILELKSSGGSTKEENIWQLRNYLEQRSDMNWGIVINFISKFGGRDFNSPKIQCDLLYKITEKSYDEENSNLDDSFKTNTECNGNPTIIHCSDNNTYSINKYWKQTVESKYYPEYDDIFKDFDDYFYQEKDDDNEDIEDVEKGITKIKVDLSQISIDTPKSIVKPRNNKKKIKPNDYLESEED